MTRIGSITISSREAATRATCILQAVVEDGKALVAEFRYEQHVYREIGPIVPGGTYRSTHVRYRRVA